MPNTAHGPTEAPSPAERLAVHVADAPARRRPAPAAADEPGRDTSSALARVVGALGGGAAAGVLAAAATALVLACLTVAARKWMWYDEILTSMLVNDPSWRHMMEGLRAGVDSAPPLYHFLARGWAAVFGGSPLSLRVFNVLGLCTALVLLWVALVRVYRWQAAAAGALLVFCGSDLVFAQIAEVRYYGLLTTLVALGVLLCHRIMMAAAPSRRLLAANVACQALLVLTHIYGGIYGGALWAALLVWDLARGVARPRVWVTYPAGWLALFAWADVYVTQRGATARSWMTPPTSGVIVNAFRFDIMAAAVVLALVLAVLAAALARRPAGAPGVQAAAAPSPEQAGGRLAMIFIAAGLMTVPLVGAAVSWLVVPMFQGRYVIASAYLISIVVAHALTTIMEAGPEVPLAPAARRIAGALGATAWGAAFVLLTHHPIYEAGLVERSYRPGLAFEDLRVDGAPATTLPIAVESAFDYLPILSYSKLPQAAFTFVLDSATAVAPKSPYREMLGYGIMPLLGRLGYTGARLENVRTFLCSHERFLVLDSPDAEWFDLRVELDPAFTQTALDTTAATRYAAGKSVIRLVRREPGRTPAVCGAAPGR